MSDTETEIRRGETHPAVLWSMSAGFIAWAVDLGSSYVLQRHACNWGSNAALHLITWICFAVSLSGFVAALPHYRNLNNRAHDLGPRPVDRAYFQILLGMGFSLAFALVIVADDLPRWIFSPCG